MVFMVAPLEMAGEILLTVQKHFWYVWEKVVKYLTPLEGPSLIFNVNSILAAYCVYLNNLTMTMVCYITLVGKTAHRLLQFEQNIP